MDSETRATAAHYVNVAPYGIAKCFSHYHVTRDGEYIVTQPNELTRDQALDEADRLNHEAGWPTLPAAAPHAAPREGEPDEDMALLRFLIERARSGPFGSGTDIELGPEEADALARIAARLASQQAALDAAQRDVAYYTEQLAALEAAARLEEGRRGQ